MPDLKCYACEREPTQQCARCGRPYCDDHGEDFCNVCLEPSSGVPSFNLYRGSLLALFVGAALAIWLIIQPSSNTSGSALPRIITPTAAAATGNLTTPAPNTGSPQTQPTAAGTARPATTSTAATPAAGATSAPTASTSTAGGTNGDYVVVSGDTLSSICSDKIRKPPTLSTSDCVTQVMSLNNLTSDVLSVGQHLKVPQ